MASTNRVNVDVAEQLLASKFGDGSFSKEKLHKLVVVDRLIPPGTLYHFIDFMFEGNLPGGGRTSLALLQEDELPLLGAPFNTWAPAPFNQVYSSISGKLTSEFLQTGHAAVEFPARVETLKAKLWSGMIPMSGNRWREKRLDDPKNFQAFFDLTLEIVRVFQFLNLEQAQQSLRDGFNWISNELAHFENAINHYRAARRITLFNAKGLWAEFMHAVLTTMSERAHSWILARVDEIQTKSKDEYEALIASTSDVETIATASKTFVARVQDLNKAMRLVDTCLFIPMEGYNGHTPSPSEIVSSIAAKNDQYLDRLDKQDWSAMTKFAADPESGYRDSKLVLDVYREGREARAPVRREIRGAPKLLGDEHWITVLKSRINWSLSHGGPRNQTWGFVVYRLTYKQSAEEWSAFQEKMRASLAGSGEWIYGADDIKDKAGFQWLDGQELGIPENDIEAAKRHFDSFRTSQSLWKRMWNQDFIVIDGESYSSFNKKEETQSNAATTGDFGPFVRLVDTAMYDAELIRQTSPGFTGDMRVQLSLLFDEVYPLLASIAQRPRDLWPLALLHPMQTYVGPTVESQENEWEMMRQLRDNMLSGFFNFLRNKQGEEEKQ